MNKKKEKYYNVESIVGKKMVDGKPYYYIKWEDYDDIFNTWEPLENLNTCLKKVENYEAKLSKKVKPEKKRTYHKLQKEGAEDKETDKEEVDEQSQKKCPYNIKSITGMKRSQGGKLPIHYVVELEETREGMPLMSLCTTEEMIDKDPRMLIDFLESHIKVREDCTYISSSLSKS